MALEKNRGRRIEPGELAVVVGAAVHALPPPDCCRRAGARVRLLDSNLKAQAGRECLPPSLQPLALTCSLASIPPRSLRRGLCGAQPRHACSQA